MMDARIRRRRTLEALKRIIIRESLKQPLVVIFEDLHSVIDAETQELLDLLVDGVTSARILMWSTTGPSTITRWGNRTCYTQISPSIRWGARAPTRCCTRCSADASLQSLKRLIIEKTQGNPLYGRRLCGRWSSKVCWSAMAPQGDQTADRDWLPLPTVHGILASRIDALPASEKGLLAELAVIGQRFPAESGQANNCQSGRLAGRSGSLQAGEFIYEQPAMEAEYTFKHASTQEVAYNSVLMERRRLLHERAG